MARMEVAGRSVVTTALVAALTIMASPVGAQSREPAETPPAPAPEPTPAPEPAPPPRPVPSAAQRAQPRAGAPGATQRSARPPAPAASAPAASGPAASGPAAPSYPAQPPAQRSAPREQYGAQSGYAPPRAVPPPRIKYREGDPIPPGYHLEERPRKGPLITGIAVGGAGYVFSVLGAGLSGFDNQTGWLAVPVAGPWITLGTREDACRFREDHHDFCYTDSYADVGLVLSGLMQGAGVLLIGIGYAAPRPWLVRNDVATLTIRPVQYGKHGHGAALVGTF